MKEDEAKDLKLRRLFINPTNLCNLHCRFCWRNTNEKGRQDPSCRGLSTEKYLQIVEDAVDLGCEEFTISGGGEPLARRENFSKMMKRIKELEREQNREIRGEIVTNGTLLDGALIKKMVEMEWNNIGVSLHSTRAQMNDFLMGKTGAFKKIIKKIRKINQLKENSESKPEVVSNFVITKYNYTELAEMVDLAANLNIRCVNFRTLTEHSPAVSELSLDHSEIEKLKDTAKEVKEMSGRLRLGVEFDFDIEELGNDDFVSFEKDPPENAEKYVCYKFQNQQGFCVLPFQEAAVQANGEFYPCCSFPKMDDEEPVDKLEDKSLEEAWTGERMNKFRRKILKNEFPKDCIDCNPDTSAYKERRLELENKFLEG